MAKTKSQQQARSKKTKKTDTDIKGAKQEQEVTEIEMTDLSDLQKLASIVTGEKKLRDRAEKMEKLKQSAIKKQRALMTANVSAGRAKIEDENDLTEEEMLALGLRDKVVQNIKLYEWEAPVRILNPLNMRQFSYLVFACLLFIVYLAVLSKFALMFALIALLFVIYVAGTTEPPKTVHYITTRGIDSFDKLYEWYTLDKFWFVKRGDQYILHVSTNLRLPGELIMLCTHAEAAAIFVLLQDKLLYKEIKTQNRLTKALNGEYVPMESI